jgi:signal transduction histidine kinase
MLSTPSWLTRAIRIVVVAAWVALALGILGSATLRTAYELLIAAAIASGAFAAALTYAPRRWVTQGDLHFDLLVTAGALTTASSAALTGGLGSPYLLMALTPTLLAAIAGGFRMGLTTALLSAGLLAGVATATGGVDQLASSAGTIALFPLLGLVVAQIRLLLVDSEKRAAALQQESVETEARLLRMERANELLKRLADLYSDTHSNPVEVGRSALEAIVEAYPGTFATATLFDTQGPVVVARLGTDAPDLSRIQIPLRTDGATSGVVSLGSPSTLGPEALVDIQRLLRPVAVAFANASLLQGIAQEAVEQERLRLARELHDEVGPALAAVGLSLDAATLHQGSGETANIRQIRERLGEVVDDLRTIIADLRAESYGSFLAGLKSALAEVSPEVAIDIEERRPPRTTAGRQVIAILTESVRNALRHADATHIWIDGLVDRSLITVAVHDDGKGFDLSQLPDGHYGIMGIRERADRIGASVQFESSAAGTTVYVEWKERR